MPAETLWPEREDLYSLMLLRASIGHSAFESEKQSSPVDPASCEWPSEYFDWPGVWFDTWPEKLTVKTIACDPSKGKDSKRGDYSAIIRYGRDLEGREYVEADVARRPVEQICGDLVRHAQEFRPDGIAIETNQFQELLLIPLEIARKAAGCDHLPVFTVDNVTNKDVRIRRLGTPLVQKRLRFKSRSSGTQMLIQQMRDFPGGSFDDAADAAEVARRLAYELFNKRVQQKGRMQYARIQA